MSGPKPSYPITLGETEVKRLQHLAQAHTTGQSLAVRAKIVLSAHTHPEWSNQQIAKAIGTTDRTVRKWRGRWIATHSIADAPRSGAPRGFSPSGSCSSHRNRLQSPPSARRPACSLESPNDRSCDRGGQQKVHPFQQNRGALAASRADSTLELSSVATYSRCQAISATGSPSAPALRAGSGFSEAGDLAGVHG